MDALDARDRILGGLFGLLVGDVVGVPYEFRQAGELPPLEDIELEPPDGFVRAHSNAPRGAWSDDGAQALCLLDSLLDCRRLDLVDLGRRLVDWRDRGYMAVDNVVFDVGVQTSVALAALRAGVAPEQAGPADECSNGNGSLMRVLPLALWHRGDVRQLALDSARQSSVTHGHLRAQLCCALYCLWARATLEGHSDAWSVATSLLRGLHRDDSGSIEELDHHIKPEQEPYGSGSGYVVDCLHSARVALKEATFEAVVKRAVSLGNDTDTTAAVAGGIAGLRHGLAGIPSRWLDSLAGAPLVAPLAERLLDWLELSPPATTNGG